MKKLRIRVATYNIHKCRGLDQRTNPDRIVDVIRELDADVVAVQEILDVQNARPAYDQARRITDSLVGYSRCFGENRRLHDGAYGNMTLSRLPIKVCENYDVTRRNRERRGCLRTDIVLAEDLVLHLFNVHLGTGFLERRHQARHLLSDEVLNRPEFVGPRLVVGDFNEWTRGLVSRLMGRAFASVEPRAYLGYKRTYPGVLPFLDLDRFYHDSQLSLLNVRLHRSRTALVASDHLPLVADFQLET